MREILNFLPDEIHRFFIDANRNISDITREIISIIQHQLNLQEKTVNEYNFPINLCKEAQNFLLNKYDSKTLDVGFKQILELSLYRDQDLQSLDTNCDLIWTLLGEFGLPHSSNDNDDSWPLYIFPYSLKYKDQIIDYLNENGFLIDDCLELKFSEELHFSLYGGQAWYGSLISALHQYHHSVGKIWGEKGLLIYFKRNQHTETSLTMMARKLQIHLRPQLSEYWNKNAYDVYPGILKSFHTPNAYDIDIHQIIFKHFIKIS